jgi:hypothetical protein
MKNQPDLHRWIFHIPLSDVQNPDTQEYLGEGHACLLCGKKIKNEVKHWVHMTTNLELVSSAEEFDNSQGFFAVGNECKNRLPNNFIFSL